MDDANLSFTLSERIRYLFHVRKIISEANRRRWELVPIHMDPDLSDQEIDTTDPYAMADVTFYKAMKDDTDLGFRLERVPQEMFEERTGDLDDVFNRTSVTGIIWGEPEFIVIRITDRHIYKFIGPTKRFGRETRGEWNCFFEAAACWDAFGASRFWKRIDTINHSADDRQDGVAQ